MHDYARFVIIILKKIDTLKEQTYSLEETFAVQSDREIYAFGEKKLSPLRNFGKSYIIYATGVLTVTSFNPITKNKNLLK